MPPTSPSQRIDQFMEEASEDLVARDYFAAERLCLKALRTALVHRDFDRIARITLPLQECRRQKRDQAVESGAVFCVDAELPDASELLPGCYLVSPPRVGADGRALREMADELGVPILVLVREPTTRDGQWPLVALGPSTVRVKVKAPHVPAPQASTDQNAGGHEPIPVTLPSPEWFVEASEALGDGAIAGVLERPGLHHALTPDQVVVLLAQRLEACPDHEKLHQRLIEAARSAARADPSALHPPRKDRLDELADLEEDHDQPEHARSRKRK